MSNLTSVYEISIWEDIWDGSQFTEKKVCVIGTDTMQYQGRAIEPNFVRNVNGQKKFSFKMYKKFIDNVTGEKIDNEFSNMLGNEVKIKLYYENQWYDFYIKNIVENSSTYLYTYQLEDAWVQELSKNGYGVTLDEKNRRGQGTIGQLAEWTLENTDWDVESEAIVDKVEENLIYLRVENPDGVNVVHLIDQINLREGLKQEESHIEYGSIILGFYSSCKNRPHRFQFIYIDDFENNVKLTEDYIIDNDNCQYYIDIPKPLDDNEDTKKYRKVTYSGVDYFLPQDFNIVSKNIADDDSTISHKYKGKRYGFSQQVEYVQALDTYAKKFVKDNIDYYGYLESDFRSPVFTEDIITNRDFKGITGWIPAYKGSMPDAKAIKAPTVDPVYGRFVSNNFISATDELANGTFGTNKNDNPYHSYLRIDFKEDSAAESLLFNTGIYDNRNTIGFIQNGDTWILETDPKQLSGLDTTFNRVDTYGNLTNWDIYIAEVEYQPSIGSYIVKNPWTVYERINDKMGRLTFRLPDGVDSSEDDFKNRNLRLVFSPKGRKSNFYLKSISLYKENRNEEGVLVRPTDSPFTTNDGSDELLINYVENQYVMVKKDDCLPSLDGELPSKDSIRKERIKEKNLDYQVWRPVYSTDGQKIRTVSIKESNYFNILQSLAEKFECWLDINVSHNSNGEIYSVDGKPKKIRFKNYAGETNYASFKYGVNLKEIQRTYESKQMVTSLIVKPNNNDFAQNKSCTIQSAGVNPTGENNIYDFQYYHKTGLLASRPFVASMYYSTNPDDNSISQHGKDIDSNHTTTNLQNYFNRIKIINNDLETINTEITNLTLEKTQLSAQKATQESLKRAADGGVEEARDNFFALTGLYPEQIAASNWSKLECTGTSFENNISKYNGTIITSSQNGATNSPKFTFNLQYGGNTWINKNGYKIYTFPGETDITPNTEYVIEKTSTSNNNIGLQISKKATNGDLYPYRSNYRYHLHFKMQVVEGASQKLYTIGIHPAPFKKIEIVVTAENQTIVGQVSNTHLCKINGDNGVERGLYSVDVYATMFDINATYPQFYIQPNKNTTNPVKVKITDISIKEHPFETLTTKGTFYFKPTIKITTTNNTVSTKTVSISSEVLPYSIEGSTTYNFSLENEVGTSSYNKYLQEYATCLSTSNDSAKQIETLSNTLNATEANLNNQLIQRDTKTNYKKVLNDLFIKTYSRFIQEGTWISEEYIEADKYYTDALGVMYNSCYPQVAYNIQTVAINRIPGYEDFTFNLGDSTYAEDPNFFGSDIRTKVVVTEISENLDDASKSTIKVQNFKNQFQDLFQKITATVQQTQYNTGAYRKAVELAEADTAIRGKFVTDALAGMAESFSIAGQTSVEQGDYGILLTDSTTKNQMQLIGGGILMSVQDPDTGERAWKTGLTPEGISASLITAGRLNTGTIEIMNGNDSTFKWNSMGLTAFDVDWTGDRVSGTPDYYKFVRFDKHGIYGIDSANNINGISMNGDSWIPTSHQEIDDNATFALTWEGLKVTGNNGAVARIGKQNDNIIKVNNGIIDTFIVDKDGNTLIRGDVQFGDGTSITTVRDNLLPFSALQHCVDWQFVNGDGFVSEIARTMMYNNHQTLHIKNTNSSTVWTGATKYLDIDDRDFAENETLTISCWYYVPSQTIDSSPNCEFGFSLKAEVDDAIKDQTYYALRFEKAEQNKWKKLVRTFTFEKNCVNSRIYAFVRNKGEVYFADFKVERGSCATDWIKNKHDDFNMGDNLYTGGNLTLSAGTAPNYYYDFTTGKAYSNPNTSGASNQLSESIVINQAYYFSADIKATWADGLSNQYKNITIAFYSTSADGTSWKYNTQSNLNIIDNKIFGLLRTPTNLYGGEDYTTKYPTNHLIIYCGQTGHTRGNIITLSNIKIYKGTIAEDFQSSVNGNFSWKFDKSQGIIMWSGEQISDNEVFKISKTTNGNVLQMNGTGTFEGDITANKFIISKNAETNIAFPQTRLPYDDFVIYNSMADSARVKVSPGEIIEICYKVKSAYDNKKKTCFLHQFYQSESGNRKAFIWDGSQTWNNANATAPKNLVTTYKEYKTRLIVPEDCHYYAAGLRANLVTGDTDADGNGVADAGTLTFTDIIIKGASVTKQLIDKFDIQAGSIAIYDKNDSTKPLIFGAYKNPNGEPKVEMAGWQATIQQFNGAREDKNDNTSNAEQIKVFQSSVRSGDYNYQCGLATPTNAKDPVIWAGMRTTRTAPYYNPWAVANASDWYLQKALDERTPFYVTRNGELHASAGEIAGWDITSTGIYKELEDRTEGKKYRVKLQANPNQGVTQAAFKVAELDDEGLEVSYPFYIRYDGTIQAQRGTIGGFDIGVNNLSTVWRHPTSSAGNKVTTLNNTGITWSSGGTSTSCTWEELVKYIRKASDGLEL